MIPNKPFYFMRHGQTDYNLENRCMGNLDIPLNDEGEKQAYEALEKLNELQITSIITSPLKRALRTAEIVSEHLKLPLCFSDDLKEANWGDQQGKLKSDLSLFSQWRNGLTFNNGESFEDVKARTAQVLNQYLQKEDVQLFVSHGGVYWSILELLRLPFDDAHNCDVFYFTPVSEGSNQWVCGRI
jgi:broad specificity phosphatase PhoE